VKIRPLHEIDLARIAPLPRDERRRRLEQLRAGKPPFSYEPLRRSLGDIFNVALGLFGQVAPLPWDRVARAIAENSRTPEEREANIAVAQALHGYACRNNLTGRRHDFLALPLGEGNRVAYWLPLVLGVDGRALVPFIDPRRSSKHLTAEARRFVFSVMHERIRAADPDFADVALGIFQFGVDEDGTRFPVLWTDDGIDLHDFEALDQMVRETYELWWEICEQREAEARTRGAGTGGLFGDAA
jgi:hypothetical protein